MWLLGEEAGAKPVGPRGRAARVGGVHRRVIALAAAIRELVATSDPMVVKLPLRDGGDSSLPC